MVEQRNAERDTPFEPDPDRELDSILREYKRALRLGFLPPSTSADEETDTEVAEPRPEEIAALAARGFPKGEEEATRRFVRGSDEWLTILATADALDGLDVREPSTPSKTPAVQRSPLQVPRFAALLVLVVAIAALGVWLFERLGPEPVRPMPENVAWVWSSADATLVPGEMFPLPSRLSGHLSGDPVSPEPPRRVAEGRIARALDRSSSEFARNPSVDLWVRHAQLVLASRDEGSWIDPARFLPAATLEEPRVLALVGLFRLRTGHTEGAIEAIAPLAQGDLRSRWNLALALGRQGARLAAARVFRSIGESGAEAAGSLGGESIVQAFDQLWGECASERNLALEAGAVLRGEALPPSVLRELGSVLRDLEAGDTSSLSGNMDDLAWSLMLERLFEFRAGERPGYLLELGLTDEGARVLHQAYARKRVDTKADEVLELFEGMDAAGLARWRGTRRDLLRAAAALEQSPARGRAQLLDLESAVAATGDRWLRWEWLRLRAKASLLEEPANMAQFEAARTEGEAIAADISGWAGRLLTIEDYLLGVQRIPAVQELQDTILGKGRLHRITATRAQLCLAAKLLAQGRSSEADDEAARVLDECRRLEVWEAVPHAWRIRAAAAVERGLPHLGFFYYLEAIEISLAMERGMDAAHAAIQQSECAGLIDLESLAFTGYTENWQRLEPVFLDTPARVEWLRLRIREAVAQGDLEEARRGLARARGFVTGRVDLEALIGLDEFLLTERSGAPSPREVEALLRRLDVALEPVELRRSMRLLARDLLHWHIQDPTAGMAVWAWNALELARRRAWESATKSEAEELLRFSPTSSARVFPGTALIASLDYRSRRAHLVWVGDRVLVHVEDPTSPEPEAFALPEGTLRIVSLDFQFETTSRLGGLHLADGRRARATCSIAFAPTAAHAIRALGSRPATANEPLFVLGPLNVPGFEVLNDSGAMVEELAGEGYESFEVLRGPAARLEALRGPLARADWIQIVAHTRLQRDVPGHSTLLLEGSDANRETGRLVQVTELLDGVRLREASTVVLSACQAAQRVLETDPFGMATYFLRAGAERVIAPTTRVSDHAMARITAELFRLTHAGVEPEEALQRLRLQNGWGEEERRALDSLVVILGKS